MALRAGRGGVRSDKRESRGAVVERSAVPADCRVASGAVGGRKRRSGRRVHRIVRLLPGSQVAAGVSTIVRLNGQRIVTADVALRASRDFAGGSHLVRIRQREARGAVIKLAVGPHGDGVAGGAGRSGSGEIRGHVIRHVSAQRLGAVPGRQVAAHAIRIGRSQRIVVVDVALRAGRGGVRSDKRESRGAVVKRSAVPADCGVAIGAIRGRKATVRK